MSGMFPSIGIGGYRTGQEAVGKPPLSYNLSQIFVYRTN